MDFQLIHIIALLVTGVGVGFASGLLGIGGCFIMIPVQFWVLTSVGVDPNLAIRMAFGTNLAVVLPTAISGAAGHHRKGAVLWKQGVTLGISGLLGSFLGAWIATITPGNVLKILFGIVILAGALRMLTAKPPRQDNHPNEKTLPYILWGFPLGIVSGIVGIGGGVVVIPVLVMALGFTMHQAVGTSTALMIFTSIGGIISYLFYGLGIEGLPPYSTGYINWLQVLLLAGTAVPMAQVGVKTAHILPAKQLKYVFIVIMVIMGLKMIGLF